MTTKGTKEYAESNVNCFYNCTRCCRYCYAKFMALRFGRIESEEEWGIMKPNIKAINKQYRKRNGRIMFPTSHDITNDTKEICGDVLFKLLNTGNDVLIVSKPELEVIKYVCKRFEYYKNQLEFRFTITSHDNEALKFFEPNAPNFEQRLMALAYAYERGFKTSVSIEPYLTFYRNKGYEVKNLVSIVNHFVSETIWIGVMREDIRLRLLNQVSKSSDRIDGMEYLKIEARLKAKEMLGTIYAKESVREIVDSLKELPSEVKSKVRLKDSIVNALGLEGKTIV